MGNTIIIMFGNPAVPARITEFFTMSWLKKGLISTFILCLSAGMAFGSRVKTFVSSRPWQVIIDLNDFEPCDIVDGKTILAGQTQDGITVTITIEKVSPGTAATKVRNVYGRSDALQFGKAGTVEENDVNGIAVITYEESEPGFPDANKAVCDARGYRRTFKGYVVKDDIAFAVGLSVDMSRHKREQTLAIIGTLRVEPSTEMEELAKIADQILKSYKTEDNKNDVLQKVLDAAQDFIKKYPGNPDIFVLRADCYLQQGQIYPARKNCSISLTNRKTQILKNGALLWTLYQDMGLCHLNLVIYSQAGKYLELAYDQAKKQGKSRYIASSAYALACLSAKTGQTETCIRYLEESMKIDPSLKWKARSDSSFAKVKHDKRFKEAVKSDFIAEIFSRKTWPKDLKKWALACGAVLNERNGDRHDTLLPCDRTKSNVKRWEKIIYEYWAVKDREDLLDSLLWLEEGGRRVVFEKLGRFIQGLSDDQYTQLVELKSYDIEELNRIQYARKYYEKLGGKSILGCDYTRYICLCRWGYLLGFLTEQEAWERIIPSARMLQKKFDSWEDLGQNYLIGRRFCSYESTQEEGWLLDDAFQRLLDMRSSPWNKYPWDMDLTGRTKSSSLNKKSSKIDG